jgi:hypothetical protein
MVDKKARWKVDMTVKQKADKMDFLTADAMVDEMADLLACKMVEA